MDYVTFSNGVNMPLIGTGTNTYGKEQNNYNGALKDSIPELVSALSLGYRSIDAAIMYRNEALVGRVLAESDVPREQLFITTKIPAELPYISSKEATRQAINNSLAHFQTDYLDLLLIHFPIENAQQLQHTWEVFEEYYEAGKLKAIGVSNFQVPHLHTLASFARILPMVNQIQINAKEKNDALVAYLQQHNIIPVAWGPMKATAAQMAMLDSIGKTYGKTGAQILLKYQIQRGVVVIPKSHNAKNQAANLQLFDFELSAAHIAAIEQL